MGYSFILKLTIMPDSNPVAPTDAIPHLGSFDEPSLDSAFATLSEEVRRGASSLADAEAREAFRLEWLGRRQGRLKLISDAWLKSAPPEARRPLGMRFNQLKQQIEEALEAPVAHGSKADVRGIDISLPGSARHRGIAHPLLSPTA